MIAVEKALSTSFWAVPAFIRVEPASTSGPVSTPTCTSASAASSASGLALTSTVWAPTRRASRSAPATYGVRPLAASPTTTSPGVSAAGRGGSRVAVVLDALERGLERVGAAREVGDDRRPGATPYVGGSSAASMAAIRPEVPAPK